LGDSEEKESVVGATGVAGGESSQRRGTRPAGIPLSASESGNGVNV
jgi:hypothetical protein